MKKLINANLKHYSIPDYINLQSYREDLII